MLVTMAALGGCQLLDRSGDGGGGSVADDGRTYELTAPATVLGGAYKKVDSIGGVAVRSSELKGMRSLGVAHPEAVTAMYLAGKGSGQRSISYSGVHGDVEDPEKVVDALFAEMERKVAESDGAATYVGSPEEFTPAGFKNGIMKCQTSEFRTSGPNPAAGEDGGERRTYRNPMCVWGDHSTVGYVSPTHAAAAARGDSPSLAATAKLTAELRADVRVTTE